MTDDPWPEIRAMARKEARLSAQWIKRVRAIGRNRETSRAQPGLSEGDGCAHHPDDMYGGEFWNGWIMRR